MSVDKCSKMLVCEVWSCVVLCRKREQRENVDHPVRHMLFYLHIGIACLGNELENLISQALATANFDEERGQTCTVDATW